MYFCDLRNRVGLIRRTPLCRATGQIIFFHVSFGWGKQIHSFLLMQETEANVYFLFYLEIFMEMTDERII